MAALVVEKKKDPEELLRVCPAAALDAKSPPLGNSIEPGGGQ